jgi:hypothetical protein
VARKAKPTAVDPDEELLGFDEVAAWVGKGVSTLKRYRKLGQMPDGRLVGGERKFTRGEIKKWLLEAEPAKPWVPEAEAPHRRAQMMLVEAERLLEETRREVEVAKKMADLVPITAEEQLIVDRIRVRLQASRDHKGRGGVQWGRVLEGAVGYEGVLAVLNAYLSTWSPDEIAKLPPAAQPSRFTTTQAVIAYRDTLQQEPKRGADAGLHLEMQFFFDEVVGRIIAMDARRKEIESRPAAIVFCDTEFSDSTAPQLISIALVAYDGTTLYREVDRVPPKCSKFVKEHVLPHLEREPDVMAPIDQIAVSISEWLGSFGHTVITADSDEDWKLLQDVLQHLPPGAGQQPSTRFQRVLRPDPRDAMDDGERALAERYNKAVNSYHARTGAPKHHALHDARAMRLAWLLIETDGLTDQLVPPSLQPVA